MEKEHINTLVAFAKALGGSLISTQYKNNKKQLVWECSKGHQWKTSWSNVKHGSWCLKCHYYNFYIKNKLETLKKYALSRGGVLLSTEYINKKSKLLWKCSKGHQWLAKWGDVNSKKSWCPTCNHSKPDILELQLYANNKKGLLISDNYITCREKLIWQCEKKHIWKSSWASIKNSNSWCPICANKIYKSELECRDILEAYFNKLFPSTRFYYTNNINNKKTYIELDCYNEELKIALEYNGEQHYRQVKYFHKQGKTLEEQQSRDKNKIKYCLDNNIKLIIVPYTENKTLKEFILNGLKQYDYKILLDR